MVPAWQPNCQTWRRVVDGAQLQVLRFHPSSSHAQVCSLCPWLCMRRARFRRARLVQQLTGANSAEALQNTTRECPSGDLSIERVLGDRFPQRNAAICCRLCAASRCSRVCQGRVFPNGNSNGGCIHTVASYEALGSSPLGAGALGHSSASLRPSLGCANPQM